MMEEYNETNYISEKIGSNYISISAPWDSDNNYDVSNVSLEMELNMIDAATVLKSLSLVDGQLLLSGEKITFKKDGTSATMYPYLNGMKLPMKHRKAIVNKMLKSCDLLDKNNTKDGTIYTIVYKDKPFKCFVENNANYVWFNIESDKDKLDRYYKKQFQLKTKTASTASMEMLPEVEHPLHGNVITGFPTQLDDLEDRLDDAIDLIMACGQIPELQHKLEELKILLDM
jgi:predicted enzyme related to lactoylglutathione lyase